MTRLAMEGDDHMRNGSELLTRRGGPNYVHLRRFGFWARIIQPNGNYVTGHAAECSHDGANFFSARLSSDCPARVTCPECRKTRGYRLAKAKHMESDHDE